MIIELQRAVHLIGVHIEQAASDVGVTQAEAHVLAQLARGGPQTVGELLRGFGHKRSTLTNVLDRLDLRGLIERRVNPHDRRSFIVGATKEGDLAARRVVAVLDQLERAVRAKVSARDVDGLEAVVDALAHLKR